VAKKSVAREFNIDEATLQNVLKKIRFQHHWEGFSLQLEERLVEHVKKLDSLFYGVTLRDLRRAAFDYAKEK
jgi:hypothetical protein